MFGLPPFAAAIAIGLSTAILSCWLTDRGFHQIERPPGKWSILSAVAAALISGAFTVVYLKSNCQTTPDVQPTLFWMHGRIVYQALLIVLLIAATATDLDSYLIPDAITIPGMAIGVIGAVAAGDLQIAHVWVDWNQEIPQIAGPYRPEWLSAHPHLHGLAWSLAGLLTGMALTWLVRIIASKVMGMEALGFGDVMLMGMIGSFLGWQPTVVVFLLAPLCALTIGLAVRMLGGKSYIPYGPYLAVAAMIVMFGWRWIWMFEFQLHGAVAPNDREGVFAVRRLFGDWPSLAILAGIIVLGLTLLLGLNRLYRMIPGRRQNSHTASGPSS